MGHGACQILEDIPWIGSQMSNRFDITTEAACIEAAQDAGLTEDGWDWDNTTGVPAHTKYQTDLNDALNTTWTSWQMFLLLGGITLGVSLIDHVVEYCLKKDCDSRERSPLQIYLWSKWGCGKTKEEPMTAPPTT